MKTLPILLSVCFQFSYHSTYLFLCNGLCNPERRCLHSQISVKTTKNWLVLNIFLHNLFSQSFLRIYGYSERTFWLRKLNIMQICSRFRKIKYCGKKRILLQHKLSFFHKYAAQLNRKGQSLLQKPIEGRNHTKLWKI